MGFNEAQFQAAVDQINNGLRELGNKINEMRAAANAALSNWYIPGFVKDAIRWLANTLADLAKTVLDKIIEVMKGVAAPVLFFRYAFEWQDIRGVATGVGGQLNPGVLTATRTWRGSASTAYGQSIPPQGAAASKIATIADKTAVSLLACAAAGLAFYVAIGFILIKFIAAMVTATAAFGSAVFSWAGAAIIVEEAGVNSAAIWSAIGALTVLLGAQSQVMVTLHGESVDNSTFPGGHWPDPTTRLFNDGTVADGDADWSLAR